MTWDVEKWKSVVFSDEKKLNLVGPDGWASFWHHICKEERIWPKRRSGGGSMIVWGCFYSCDECVMVFGRETEI